MFRRRRNDQQIIYLGVLGFVVAGVAWLKERDRRYTEVRAATDKALQVASEKDALALGLAREIQTYKDEKANELRSQIEGERGNYATKSMVIGLYGFVVVALGVAVTVVVALR